jgi:hypothetical protein
MQNIVVRKPFGEYPYRQSRKILEDNIKINLKDVDF